MTHFDLVSRFPNVCLNFPAGQRTVQEADGPHAGHQPPQDGRGNQRRNRGRRCEGRPGQPGLANEGLRDESGEPEDVRFLLRVQHFVRHHGSNHAAHRAARVCESTAAGGLLGRDGESGW